MQKTTNGFTIVELLIVIVVIAILAAITIVAFNGIQDRARYTALFSETKQASTQLELIKADTYVPDYSSYAQQRSKVHL